MRFYEINGGTLRLDGHPIDTVTRDSLRGNLGMVLQETWLKAGTIAENIACGEARCHAEEIIAQPKGVFALLRLPNAMIPRWPRTEAISARASASCFVLPA